MKACLAAKKERAITTRFRSDDNLLGIGVGLKEVRGIATDELAVKFSSARSEARMKWAMSPCSPRP